LSLQVSNGVKLKQNKLIKIQDGQHHRNRIQLFQALLNHGTKTLLMYQGSIVLEKNIRKIHDFETSKIS
jgi:hypothetical protein